MPDDLAHLLGDFQRILSEEDRAVREKLHELQNIKVLGCDCRWCAPRDVLPIANAEVAVATPVEEPEYPWSGTPEPPPRAQVFKRPSWLRRLWSGS